MPEMREASVGKMAAAQAVELSLLVDLEARWENLRRPRLRPPSGIGSGCAWDRLALIARLAARQA
jgi:hypothetical protein